MKFSKWLAIYIILVMASSIGVGAIYHFSVKGKLDIVDSDLTVSPASFTATVSRGSEFVKKITVRNAGIEKEIYFESIVQGADPRTVSVSFRTTDGKTISSSNKLSVPAGTSSEPSEVDVYIHIRADESSEGSYTVYILAKST
jgi:hypothetical protein